MLFISGHMVGSITLAERIVPDKCISAVARGNLRARDVVMAIRRIVARAVLLAKHALTVMAGIPDFIRIGPVVLVLVGGAVGWAIGVVAGIIQEFVHVRRLCCENRIIDRALVEDILELMRVNR